MGALKYLIIGGGVVGLTSAFALQRRGHEVTVLERQPGPALETSFANGALLTPSMSDPWNAPGVWRALLTSLGREDAALQLRLRAIPSMMGWGVRFLRHSRRDRFECNTLSNLRLALYSLEIMRSWQTEVPIEYAHSTRGALRVFRDESAWEQAVAVAQRLSATGLRFQRLSQAEAVATEPALSATADQLAGAIHYTTDETGDAYQYCAGIVRELQRRGVTLTFGTEVTALELTRGRIGAVQTRRGRFFADCYLVAAGVHSAPLLQTVGIEIPLCPVKGYSITFNRPGHAVMPAIPIIDDQLHAGVVPIAQAIRVVGTAEFAGFDLRLNPARIENLLGFLRKILPQASWDGAGGTSWCGLRPMSADGVPIVGPTPISNLWINAGHGHLGWTLAAGSAQLLADRMTNRPPEVDPQPFSLARFDS
jgi:D-amino-acid dehydrogenase